METKEEHRVIAGEPSRFKKLRYLPFIVSEHYHHHYERTYITVEHTIVYGYDSRDAIDRHLKNSSEPAMFGAGMAYISVQRVDMPDHREITETGSLEEYIAKVIKDDRGNSKGTHFFEAES